MTNINDFDTSKVPTEHKEAVTPEQISPPVVTELEPRALSDVLGLTREEESQYRDKLDTLLEWVKTQTNDRSSGNLKTIFRELGNKIGTPPLGQKLVNWLAEYAYLELEELKIKKALKEFKHANI